MILTLKLSSRFPRCAAVAASALRSWKRGTSRLDHPVGADSGDLPVEIIDEYRRVAAELAQEFSGIDVSRILDLLTVGAEIIDAPPLPQPVCSAPADDKFLDWAVAGSAKYIVTGDKQLLKVFQYGKSKIANPRSFVESHLRS